MVNPIDPEFSRVRLLPNDPEWKPSLEGGDISDQFRYLFGLGDVLTEATEPHVVDPDGSYPNLGIYNFARGVFPKPPIEGMATSASTLYRVRAGQFIYSRLFAFEGSYAVVPPDLDGRFVSNEFPSFDLDLARVRPEFLAAYFKSPVVWEQLSAGSLGLGSRRQRVQVPALLAHRLMLPPLDWQNRIATVKQKLDRARSIEGEEIGKFLPALLDHAFSADTAHQQAA